MAVGDKLENLIHKLFYLLLQGVSYIVVFFYIVAIGTLLVMLDFLESKSISKKIIWCDINHSLCDYGIFCYI